jgi:pimeloyl-ACP methyl ester carboxylesterase
VNASLGIGRKVDAESAILNRRFHVDVFRLGAEPAFAVMLFGGSGVDRAQYEARAATVNPTFDGALREVAREVSFVLAYVTAPYDVPYNRFADDPEAAARWMRHVDEELLPIVPELPLYLVGYSGGAALAMNGAHESPRCFGVAGLGADAVPATLSRGPGWRECAALYYNRDDRVFSKNRAAIAELEAAEIVRCHRTLPGGHTVDDYVKNGSLAGLVRRARRLA